jgi:hypothetical protein
MSVAIGRLPRQAAALGLALVLAACGGSGGQGQPNLPDSGNPDAGSTDAGASDAGPDAGPLGDNHAPAAAFTASSTAQAMSPVSFDGSGSSDPDGDVLSYSWDFGDGERGGTATIAHSFAASGAFTVKLTVADGRGGVSTAQHAVTVSALAHGAVVAVSGLVEDVAGPVSGVQVQDVNGTSAITDATGKVSINLTAGIAHTLKLSKTGYSDQFQPVSLDASATTGYFRAAMIAREAGQTLDSAAGGALSGKDGAKITLPAGALQDASGNAVAGTIQISQTPVDVTGKMGATFPGPFAGVTPDGTQAPIASYGTTEFSLSKNGQRLQLAPGKTAAIELPLYVTQHLAGANIAAGDTIPLWSLSEKTGLWVQEGQGTVVASSASPTGFSLQAQVSHFSWWNADHLFNPYKPKPRCFLNPGPEFTPIPIPCTIGPPLPGEFSLPSPLRGALVTGSQPAYYLRADIPLNGGVALPVPSAVDFPLHACAVSDNLVYCGNLVVHGAANASDDVTILLDPVTPPGTCGAPAALTLPVSNQVISIANAAQAACLHFTAQAGQVFSLSVTIASGSLSGTLQLTGPDGQVLSSRAFGFSLDATFTVSTPLTGDYGLKIGADPGTSGSLDLSASLETPQQLTLPTTGVFQVDTVTGKKRFTFAAAAGDVVALSVEMSGPNGGSVGKVTSLVDGSSSVFKPFNYGQLTFKPTVAGSYGFEVQSNQTDGPDFLVSISKAQPIALGSAVTGALTAGSGQVLSYSFSATAGTVIAAAMGTDASPSGAPPCSFPLLRMFDPAGAEVDLIAVEQQLSAISPAVATSGIYRLDAYGRSIIAGCPNFTVRAAVVDQPASVSTTPPATTASGTLALGDHRYYSVNLNAGDVVRLALHTDDPLGANAELLPPDATTPFFQRTAIFDVSTEGSASNPSTNDRDEGSDPFVVPSSGAYLVHVSHFSKTLANAGGAFSWSLLQPAPVTLAADTLVHGSLTVPFVFDRYSVTVPAPGVWIFSARQTGPVANVFIQANLRDQTGTLLQSSSAEMVTQLAAGSYSLEVFSRISFCLPSCTPQASTYDLISPSIEPPLPIAPGDTKSGAIDVAAERDYYQFTAVAGHAYTVTTATSAGLVGLAEMYKLPASGNFADNSSADRGFGVIGTSFTFTPDTAGTWIIEIEGLGTNHASTGAYTVSLQ